MSGFVLMPLLHDPGPPRSKIAVLCLPSSTQGQAMGNPTHFSLEVPKRAHRLLRDLYEHLGDSDGTGLSMKATFLLSVSMPIVILPIERILKYKRNPAEVHMNDAIINARLADAVDQALDFDGKVHDTKFFAGSWQYAVLEKGYGFPNLAADGLPINVAEQLDSPNAIEDARNLSANRFCKILRNALAHGGVLYLDQNGRSVPGSPVRRFAFVSTDNPKNPTKLFFLRIKMADYRLFLERWIDWLNEEAMEVILAENLGLEATDAEEVTSIGDIAVNTAK